MPSESQKVLDRKREILAAAALIFRRKGLEATGMRDIARELGMTASNLYYYFDNKGELLAFCQQEGLNGLLALASHVLPLDLPAEKKLYLLIVGHVELLNEGVAGSIAHLEFESLEREQQPGILARRSEYETTLRGLIQDGIQSGRFRRTDAKTAALAILGALNWTVRWFRPEGGHPAREIGREFAELLVRGLLASGLGLIAPSLSLLDTPKAAP